MHDLFLALQLIVTIATIIVVLHFWLHFLFFNVKPKTQKHLTLLRDNCNPILSPDGETHWEAEGTFNPAAIVDEAGTVHLLYRAIGGDGVSRLGYLSSTDGMHFEKPVSYPVYESHHDAYVSDFPKEFNPSYFTSGGGWTGCEDPRMTLIDGVVYMTYVAFSGWDSIRIALTSISLKDLQNKRWNWKKYALISPQGEPNKNWMLFPEKIDGKFAVLHCISPEILIEYVDNLDDLTHSPIKSRPPHDGNRNYFGREDYWDNSVRSAGPPPLKTKDGWLLLYHSMDKQDPNKYKLGAMILDLKNPTRILYRSPLPILAPDMHYENNYKPGVIYASGAVIKKRTLYVYYGGGDRHLCIAHTPLSTLLTWLKQHGAVHNK